MQGPNQLLYAKNYAPFFSKASVTVLYLLIYLSSVHTVRLQDDFVQQRTSECPFELHTTSTVYPVHIADKVIVLGDKPASDPTESLAIRS